MATFFGKGLRSWEKLANFVAKMSIVAYIVLLIALMVVELLYMRFARAIGAVSACHERDSHHRPTVIGGGIVFYVAAVVAV